MLRSLNTAMSGLQQFQQQIDVVGNNIANVNTTAFKTARTDFEDSFNQALAGNGSSGQVGSGVGTSAITNNFNAGVTSRTGVDTDLSISGQGFFMLRDTVDNSQRATRAGNFHLNSSSFLVTNDGLRVQGFSDSALGARGDILIDATGAPATTAVGATVESFNIDQNGSINVRMTDGTTFVRGQVLLQNFRDQSRLVKEGDNRFSGTDAAGPLSQISAPQTNGLGAIESGALELSNVDLTNEMSTLIVAQRAFQANARIITTSDDILQEIVNLKR